MTETQPTAGILSLATYIPRAYHDADYIAANSDTPADIMQNYVDATGHAPMLPEWAAGFWQCKLRYRTQDELLEVAREYKRRSLPLSIIVIDYFHWTLQGDWKLDPEYWPDPEGMVKELEAIEGISSITFVLHEEQAEV